MKEMDGSLKRVFIINLVFAICFYLVTPLFPLFLDSLHITESQIGLILGIGSFSAIFSTLVSGYLADKFGKKNIFYFSLLSRSISILAVIYTGNWIFLTLIWIIFNLSQSLFEPARLSYIGEKATLENRGKLYGFMNLAWPIAGIIGPYLSGRFAETLGWSIVFLISILINSIGLIPLSSVEQGPKKQELDKRPSFDRKYLPELGVHFSFHVLVTTAIGIMNMAIPLFLSNQFDLKYSTIGLFFTVSNILTMFTQLPSGALADKYGMKRITLVAISIVPFTYMAWIFVENWLILLFAYSISMGLWSMTWSATTVLVSEVVPEFMTGTAISIRMAAYRVGYTLGPIIGGTLLSSNGSILPFIVATISITLAIPIGLKFKEKRGVPRSSIIGGCKA
jgi:MFS family permease